ncbi:hypothetical protein JYT76_01935 [Olleya sp. AH-315-F22]|nr:hypothetical protein [Olleya sp. AH-315-F22]
MMEKIEFIFDNVLLKGLVLDRDRFFIKVQLISPFEAWENYSIISGWCRATPNHFLTEYGDRVIRRLLIESYQKYKILYDSIDRISNVYINLKFELFSLYEISVNEMRNNIKMKLEDWFFDAIFTSSVTGLIATNNDRNYIFEIIENHLKQKENKKKWKNYGIWLRTIYPKYKNF